MRKPEGWENVEAAYAGETERLKAGGYILKIVQADIELSRNSQREMLVLSYDIQEGENTGFFKRSYERAKQYNADAKWGGRYFQLTDGDSTRFFKGLIELIEKSNSGYKWEWNEKSLAGKLIGGVFGEEEYINRKNKKTVICKLQTIKTVGDIMNNNYEIPPLKKLETTPMDSFGSEQYPDEDIPF